jgi:hypothetical protein
MHIMACTNNLVSPKDIDNGNVTWVAQRTLELERHSNVGVRILLEVHESA